MQRPSLGLNPAPSLPQPLMLLLQGLQPSLALRPDKTMSCLGKSPPLGCLHCQLAAPPTPSAPEHARPSLHEQQQEKRCSLHITTTGRPEEPGHCCHPLGTGMTKAPLGGSSSEASSLQKHTQAKGKGEEEAGSSKGLPLSVQRAGTQAEGLPFAGVLRFCRVYLKLRRGF